jgi:PAT family beta-lactamase induction signal transducer AmpG
MLVSTAGALFLVTGFEHFGLVKSAAWTGGYLAMAALVMVGIITTFLATEPEKSATAETDHAAHQRENPLWRLVLTAVAALMDFFKHDMALAALVFVILYKLTDALAGQITATFVIKIGFSRDEYAAIIKGVGFAATLLGGFGGGFLARACPLASSLWIAGILQALGVLGFSWQAVVGHDPATLVAAITVENFTNAMGTVVFVAYLSALCNNPLHTATQYALLTALSAVARTYFAASAGYIVASTGWVAFFAICALAGAPALMLLIWLQRGGHFQALDRAWEPHRAKGA